MPPRSAMAQSLQSFPTVTPKVGDLSFRWYSISAVPRISTAKIAAQHVSKTSNAIHATVMALLSAEKGSKTMPQIALNAPWLWDAVSA